MSAHRPTNVQVVFAALLVTATLISPVPRASATPQVSSAPTVAEPTPKIPVTAQDHLDMATAYQKKAASYRDEAAMHRKMYADYKKSAVGVKGQENPWVRKMREHCDRYIKDAEALAADADKFAEFHSLRAAELQGK